MGKRNPRTPTLSMRNSRWSRSLCLSCSNDFNLGLSMGSFVLRTAPVSLHLFSLSAACGFANALDHGGFNCGSRRKRIKTQPGIKTGPVHAQGGLYLLDSVVVEG